MMRRTLGRSGIEVSAMGLGCWAIGGPAWRDGKPIGWGDVDDAESIRAIRRALDLGVTLLDTADVYGCGHSEKIVGQAVAGRRGQVTVATKFGLVFDEGTGQAGGTCARPSYIRQACDASLRRLGTDHIDLYQFHLWQYPAEQVGEVVDTLEDLVAAGKVRWYGWSTDDAVAAGEFAKGAHCTAIQQSLNLLDGSAEVLALCEERDLASLCRGPLARGLLTGKFGHDSVLPANDIRHNWNFQEGKIAEGLRAVRAIQEALTADGRSLAQAALGWLWARSGRTIPIPGFKTVAQVEENAGAMRFGPLPGEVMRRVEELLGRSRAQE